MVQSVADQFGIAQVGCLAESFRPEKQPVVTVFGNDQAASVRRTDDLPYPDGSVIVMETAGASRTSKVNRGSTTKATSRRPMSSAST